MSKNYFKIGFLIVAGLSAVFILRRNTKKDDVAREVANSEVAVTEVKMQSAQSELMSASEIKKNLKLEAISMIKGASVKSKKDELQKASKNSSTERKYLTINENAMIARALTQSLIVVPMSNATQARIVFDQVKKYNGAMIFTGHSVTDKKKRLGNASLLISGNYVEGGIVDNKGQNYRLMRDLNGTYFDKYPGNAKLE